MSKHALIMPYERLIDLKINDKGKGYYFEFEKEQVKFDADDDDFKEWRKGMSVIKFHRNSRGKWAVWNYQTNKDALGKISYKPLKPTDQAFIELDTHAKLLATKDEQRENMIAVGMVILGVLLIANGAISWWYQGEIHKTETAVVDAIYNTADQLQSNCVFNVTVDTMRSFCADYFGEEVY